MRLKLLIWRDKSKRTSRLELMDLKFIMGKEVARCRKGIFISQMRYVLDLLKEKGKLSPTTPFPRIWRSHAPENDTLVDKGQYRCLVGERERTNTA